MKLSPGTSMDSYGVVHCMPIGEDDMVCGGYDPNVESFRCGCAPRVHHFQCAWCRRLCGWCFGCSHEDSELPVDLCDDCWVEQDGQR